MKNRKQIIAFLCAVVMLLTCAACKKNPTTTDDSSDYYEEIEIIDGTGSSTAGSKDSSGTQSGSGGSTSKGNGGTASTVKVPENKTGKKLIDSGLDFKGATFTKTIVGTVSSEVMRRMEAFGKKYNCKLKLVRLQWESYNNQVAASIAAGDPYDICGLHPRFFVSSLNADLYEPLEKYITDADWYDSKKPNAGGLDKHWCNAFGADGHLYAAATHDTSYAANPSVMYYNAKLFEEAGLDDPYELYKAGKWTWDTFEKMGNKVKNAAKGKYIIGQDFNVGHVVGSNTSSSYITVKNGKPSINLSDPNAIVAFNRAQKWFNKNTGIVGPKDYSDNSTEFINGNYYMFTADSAYGPLNLMPQVAKSPAFDNNVKNLKIVPMFIGPNGSKDSPSFGGVNGKSAAKGADPRVCIAWAEFSCVFDDPMKDEDPYLYSDEQRAILQSLYDAPNRKYYTNIYETISNNSQVLYNEILSAVRDGGDYAQAINQRKKTIEDCVNQAIGKHTLGYFSKTF